MEEIWKNVVGYEGLYQVSNLGRIKEVCNKPVAQLDLNGIEINRFISLREASNKTGCSYKSMSLCALGKTKSSGGYIWRYI